MGWSTFLSGFIIWLIRRAFVGITTLREVRGERATLAVAQERTRFARDMHDLLGHTLSLIVVKSEVVRRLAHRPGRRRAGGRRHREGGSAGSRGGQGGDDRLP